MTRKPFHRAAFGDRNGSHELLAFSGDKDIFFSLPAMEVDLPDQAPAGIQWMPFIRGWSYRDRYLFSRTEPDNQAKRLGMVRTQLIAIPSDLIREVENIDLIFEALEPVRLKNDQLEPVELDLPELLRMRDEGPTDNRLVAIAEILVTSGRDNAAVLSTQDGFADLVTALWQKLPKDFRVDLKFGVSFTPTDLQSRGLHLACAPNALSGRWSNYPRVISKAANIERVSPAAGFLLNLPEGQPIEEGLSEIGVRPKRLQDISLFIRLASRWKRRNELSNEELRALARELVEVSPEPESSAEAKQEILEKLAATIRASRADDILALRTVKASAFRQPSIAELGKSVSDWGFQRFLGGKPTDIADLNDVISALARPAPPEWMTWLREGFTVALSKGGSVVSKTCWNLWTKNDATFETIANSIPFSESLEQSLFDSAPSKINATIGEKVAEWCRNRGWLRLHARALRAFLDWRTALQRQLALKTDVQKIEPIRVALSDVPAKELVTFTMQEKDVRVRQCAAEVCERQPGTFEYFVGSEAGWCDLLSRALKIDKNFLARVRNAKTLLHSLLDAHLADCTIEESLWSAFAESNLADVADYTKRRELWDRIPSGLRTEYLRQTAHGWSTSFYSGTGQVSDLEAPLRQALFVIPAEGRFPITSPALLSNGLTLLKECPEGTEQTFIEWIDALLLSGQWLTTDQAKDVADLLKKRKWENGAIRLLDYGKSKKRNDFGLAWDAYWSSLGSLERLFLRFTALGGGSASPFTSAQETSQEQKLTALFVTALAVEFVAVTEHLDQFKEESRGDTVYGIGNFLQGGQICEVVVVQCGMGNERASFETERAIKNYAPAYAFFVGVAGGLKDDLSLGDVVAADKVYGYDFGKSDIGFKSRPEAPYVSYRASQRALATARSDRWLKRIRGNRTRDPKVFVKPIAAGDKVLASLNSPEIEMLRERYNDAYAVEMEGFGFCIAAHANATVTFALIRGISDLIEDKDRSDKGGYQQTAAKNAAGFAFEMLAGFVGAKKTR